MSGTGAKSKGDDKSAGREGAAGSAPLTSVLFVCTMNSIRSPMAERILKALHGRRLFCDSAGTDAGEVDGFAVAVMAEKGLDMANHNVKTLEDLDDIYFDLIVTLSPQAHHRILDMTAGQAVDIEYWPTLDPSTVAGSRAQVRRATTRCVR